MNETTDLTRRKMLASISVAGAAGAGAGLGTSALFDDREEVETNTLAAGTLDLKVDWEEHYSYPQVYGFGDPAVDDQGNGLDIQRSEPTSNTDEYVKLPDPESPVVWVHQDDLDAYMSNTAIEAFPDPDNDGEQEISGDNDDAVSDSFTYRPCDDGADLPGDLTSFDENDDGVAVRTKNGDTFDDSSNEPAEPLVSLSDVKPGDFGKVTLSFHLCDNPGYVWLQAAEFEENENGIVDSENDTDDTPDDADLAENIQTVLWYDSDGDGILTASSGEKVIVRRNLKDLLTNVLESPLPLDGDLSTDFDELGDPDDSSDRECFDAGETYYLALAWWLPKDVGNEIQSDSVSFDLGFYTEQCRNNDGSLS